MRVLRIIPTIDPEVGGPSNSAVNQAISEARRGVRTTLVFTGDHRSARSTAPARARLHAAGVRTLMFPRPPWFADQAGLWGVSAQLAAWLARHVRSFDVIHVHYVWTLSTALGALLAARAGKPVVLTAHESLTRYDIDTASGSSTKRRLKLALRRLLMRNVDIVVCASPLERRDSLYPHERGAVIYHPVVEHARTASASEPRTEEFVVGYLGRLHPKKNIDVALRAIAGLPGARLIICGDGDPRHRDSLHSLASELGIAARVEWRGHVDAEGRQALFSDVHVTVMPSAYECFGMAGAEAMAAGVPVIVTDSTGIASIVTEYGAGRVVPTGEPAPLIDALDAVRTASPGALADVRARALSAASACLSFDAYGDAITRVYQDVTPAGLHDPSIPEHSLERLTAAG